MPKDLTTSYCFDRGRGSHARKQQQERGFAHNIRGLATSSPVPYLGSAEKSLAAPTPTLSRTGDTAGKRTPEYHQRRPWTKMKHGVRRVGEMIMTNYHTDSFVLPQHRLTTTEGYLELVLHDKSSVLTRSSNRRQSRLRGNDYANACPEFRPAALVVQESHPKFAHR